MTNLMQTNPVEFGNDSFAIENFKGKSSSLPLINAMSDYRRECRYSPRAGGDFEGMELKTISFTLNQLKSAIGNFNGTNKIGEEGMLSDKNIIVVKQLSSESRQGNRLKNGRLILDWSTRFKICVRIARGLAFLHEESRLKIVHRDIKPTNVLVDKDLNPKIADFGLARLHDEGQTHASTQDIWHLSTHCGDFLSDKADVYSFGVLALEIVSSKHNTSYIARDNYICLLHWVCSISLSLKDTYCSLRKTFHFWRVSGAVSSNKQSS
ncbi:hypothetical protein OSB04_017138 [Centaurea solstitialis]|uniref:non-specific serine/threonine protein kinase n=1 Tax=Centaurea solstitialis TaxID=347529 RepID=A0AA38T2C7_9ASTR|nr:hypothetical protein OSB04_017138 [Centaurea solstitialis]